MPSPRSIWSDGWQSPTIRHPTPSRADEQPAILVGGGTRLGKYEIVKRLAAGGMAEIFLARASGCRASRRWW